MISPTCVQSAVYRQIDGRGRTGSVYLLNLHFQTYLRKSIDFVKYTADNCKRSKKTPSPPTRIIMAENESLDLGASYSQRWDKPFKAIRRGAPCGEWMAIVSARSP